MINIDDDCFCDSHKARGFLNEKHSLCMNKNTD